MVGLSWAGGSAAGVVATVTGRGWVGGQGGLQSGEVGLLGHGGARDLDKTVAGAFLRVLVDETTGVDAGHLLVVEGLDFLELARALDAAVFGEAGGFVSCAAAWVCQENLQKWEAVVGVLLDLLVPAGLGVGRGIAPRVIVEGEEVAALVVGTAVHVSGHLVAVGVNIGGGVSNWNGSVASAVTVLLHVTGDGLDVWCAVGCVVVVDDLVTGEEKESVAVASESIHGCKDALKIDGVVGLGRRGTVDGILWSVDIQSEVDTSSSECAHAGVVVCRVVHGVNSDGVDSELLELCNVAGASRLVGERVGCIRGTTWLVVKTPDVETVVALPECCETSVLLKSCLQSGPSTTESKGKGTTSGLHCLALVASRRGRAESQLNVPFSCSTLLQPDGRPFPQARFRVDVRFGLCVAYHFP